MTRHDPSRCGTNEAEPASAEAPLYIVLPDTVAARVDERAADARAELRLDRAGRVCALDDDALAWLRVERAAAIGRPLATLLPARHGSLLLLRLVAAAARGVEGWRDIGCPLDSRRRLAVHAAPCPGGATLGIRTSAHIPLHVVASSRPPTAPPPLELGISHVEPEEAATAKPPLPDRRTPR